MSNQTMQNATFVGTTTDHDSVFLMSFVWLTVCVIIAALLVFVDKMILMDKKQMQAFLEAFDIDSLDKWSFYKMINNKSHYYVITRDGALVFLTIITVSAFNYFGYLSTKMNEDLIAVFTPLIPYGFYITARTASSGFKYNTTAIVTALGGSVSITMTLLLLVEAIRGTSYFDFKGIYFIVMVLSFVSLGLMITSGALESMQMRKSIKNAANGELIGTQAKMHISSRMNKRDSKYLKVGASLTPDPDSDSSVTTGVTIDTTSYMFVTIMDALIIGVPLVVVVLCAVLQSEYDNNALAVGSFFLVLIPGIYMVIAFARLVKNSCGKPDSKRLVNESATGRSLFSFFFNLFMTITAIIIALSAAGVSDLQNYKYTIAPCVLICIIMGYISLIMHTPTVIPFMLTTNTYITGTGERKEIQVIDSATGERTERVVDTAESNQASQQEGSTEVVVEGDKNV